MKLVFASSDTFIRASDGMCGVRPIGGGHNGGLNVTGIFELGSFVNVCPGARQKRCAL